jgi:hypothetical protein
MKSFRLLCAVAASLGLLVDQLDFTQAFVSADIDRDVYMEHPEGFPGSPGTVLKLVKSLYGLAQSPRNFQLTLVASLLDFGLVQTKADVCFFRHPTLLLFVVCVVDDLAVAYKDTQLVDQLVVHLSRRFDVNNLGQVSKYNGIQVVFGLDGIYLSQQAYVEEILERFNMTDAKAAATPAAVNCPLTKQQSPQSPAEVEEMASVPYMSAVGSLLYAALGTRLDIAYAVNVVAQFSVNPGPAHWTAVKRILRYLVGTANFSLFFPYGSLLAVVAHSDSDWGTDVDSRRSRTGYVVTVAGGAVVWQSKIQKSVALSSCEAELYALAEASKELMWLMGLLQELQLQCEPPTLWVDNQGAIALAKNPVAHQRSKHIHIRWFFIRDYLNSGQLIAEYVKTSDNDADFLTKATVHEIHQRHTCKFLVSFIKRQ